MKSAWVVRPKRSRSERKRTWRRGRKEAAERMGAIAVVDTDRAGWLEQVKAGGSLDHRKLIMHRFPFGEVREAFRVAGSRDHRAIKVMVTL